MRLTSFRGVIMNRYCHHWPLSALASATLCLVTTLAHSQARPAARNDPGGRVERLQQQVTEQASQIEAL